MKIIEIKVTPSGREVAYLFDERNNRVIKMLVEDYTNSIDDRTEGGTMGRYEEAPRPRKVEMPTRYPLTNEEFEDSVPVARTDLPLKTKTIIPPGIMSTMIQPGSPGAAEERRTA